MKKKTGRPRGITKKAICISFDFKTLDRITKYAVKHSISRSQLVLIAVNEYLENKGAR